MLDERPAPALMNAVDGMAPGRALDLACGAGRNAIALAARGWSVVAVDRSAEAIATLESRAEKWRIETHIADLEKNEFAIEPAGFDLIVAWLYFDRALIPRIREGVRQGGCVAAAALLQGRFAARPDELRELFEGWEVMHERNSGKTIEFIARKRISDRKKTASAPALETFLEPFPMRSAL